MSWLAHLVKAIQSSARSTLWFFVLSHWSMGHSISINKYLAAALLKWSMNLRKTKSTSSLGRLRSGTRINISACSPHSIAVYVLVDFVHVIWFVIPWTHKVGSWLVLKDVPEFSTHFLRKKGYVTDSARWWETSLFFILFLLSYSASDLLKFFQFEIYLFFCLIIL